jgi:hypothetical protein
MTITNYVQLIIISHLFETCISILLQQIVVLEFITLLIQLHLLNNLFITWINNLTVMNKFKNWFVITWCKLFLQCFKYSLLWIPSLLVSEINMSSALACPDSFFVYMQTLLIFPSFLLRYAIYNTFRNNDINSRCTRKTGHTPVAKGM